MNLVINGRTEDVPEGSTVREAVRVIGIHDPRGVAVALDGEVVPASRWDDVILSEGGKMEVVRAVQGGAG